MGSNGAYAMRMRCTRIRPFTMDGYTFLCIECISNIYRLGDRRPLSFQHAYIHYLHGEQITISKCSLCRATSNWSGPIIECPDCQTVYEQEIQPTEATTPQDPYYIRVMEMKIYEPRTMRPRPRNNLR